LLLDIIEHLTDPEELIRYLWRATAEAPNVRVVISTGNIAFAPTRLLLLAGQFNYGKRGILDMTHTRLFTFATLRRLLEGEGFKIESVRGVPAPYPEAVGESGLGFALLHLNKLLIALWRQMFSYQMFMVAAPRPALACLLRTAEEASAARATSTR
jgi:hypothetical protein